MKKSMIVLFGLLLAVGWTSSAQAQLLPEAQTRQKEMRTEPKTEMVPEQTVSQGHAASSQQRMTMSTKAPRRTTNYGPTASAVRTKQWFESQDPVTWTSNGVSRSALLTEPFTDADGMMALLKRIYTDRTIPGAKYSAPRSCDLPYQTIQHGWNIIGTHYDDAAVINVNSSQVYISKIVINDGNGNELRSCTPSNTTFPSSWTTDNSGNYWHTVSSDGGAVSIPAEWLQNDYGYAEVIVYCRPSSSTYDGVEIAVGNTTYDYYATDLTYESGYVTLVRYDFPGTIDTPPDDNGYTICLVKLKDGINYDPNVLAQEFTTTTEQLRTYFNTYFTEIQLLTDGLRVGEDGSNPGTMFSYTGDLNRFFLIGKGKMFYYSSIDKLNYDRAPFYSMYEEFSPVADNDSTGFDDFYVRMRNQEAFPIIHDCYSVNYRQHYFAMSGKQGSTEYPIHSLVFFVPDYRGIEGSDYRNYDPNHQPEIGMYIIKLQATASPDQGENMYQSTVTWHSNLSDIAKQDVPQNYMLYRIVKNRQTGEMDTIRLTPTAITDTTFVDHNLQQYDDSYQITYYVVGTPIGASNPAEFYAQSNDDKVVIPGLNDFIGLEAKYESDYDVTQEKNFYRNYLLPKNLDELGQSGITAENVGSDGRTLMLKRDGVVIAYLDLVMEGDKAYYRIRYVNSADSNTNNSNN